MEEGDGIPLIVKIGSPGAEKLGSILREMRTKNGFTQGDIAFNLEMSVATISMMEAGNRPPRMEVLKTIVEKMPDLCGYEFVWVNQEDIDLMVLHSMSDTVYGFKFVQSQQPRKNDLNSDQNLLYLCLELAQRDKSLTDQQIVKRAQYYANFIKGEE